MFRFFCLACASLADAALRMRTALAIVLYSVFTDLLLKLPAFGPNGAATSLINELTGDIFLNSLVWRNY